MIGIDSNLGYSLICIVLVTAYCSVFKIYFNYENAKSYINWINCDDRNTVRCANGNVIWGRIEMVMIFPIVFIPYLLIKASYTIEMFCVINIIFFICVILHTFAYKRAAVEYYANKEGIRIGDASNQLIMWKDITVEKEWTKASRKFQEVTVDGKRHVLIYPNENDNKIDDLDYSLDDKSIITLNEVAHSILAEQLLLIVAVVIIVFSGVYTARSTGNVLSEYNNANDYTKVYYEEQARYAKPNVTYKSNNGNIYASKKGYAVLNVYDSNGGFLYAYHPPMGFDRGNSSFSVIGSKVYIKNRNDDVFIYSKDRFVEKTDASSLYDIEYIRNIENNEYEILIYGDKLFIGYEAVLVVLIGIFMYCMASGNLNDNWSYLFFRESQRRVQKLQ